MVSVLSIYGQEKTEEEFVTPRQTDRQTDLYRHLRKMMRTDGPRLRQISDFWFMFHFSRRANISIYIYFLQQINGEARGGGLRLLCGFLVTSARATEKHARVSKEDITLWSGGSGQVCNSM